MTPLDPDGEVEKVLIELLDWFLGELNEVPPEDWDDFAKSDQVKSKEEAKSRLLEMLREAREKGFEEGERSVVTLNQLERNRRDTYAHD